MTTETDTTTMTDTATTSTTTSVVSTSTIPASAGFLPIQTTLPGSNDSLAYPNEKRAMRDFGTSLGASSKKSSPGGGLRGRPQHYGDACCYHYWGRCTTTTTTTTVTSHATAQTSTITTTSTATVTITPGAVTTITMTTTETDTTTSTATTTSTETDIFTSFTSSTSVYGACQTPNRADQVFGLAIENGQPDASLTVFGINPGASGSAYDCCVAAILEPAGAYWAWHEGGEYCVIFAADSCDAGQASGGNGEVDTQSDAAPAFVLGNGNCGAWNTLN
ncbi:hypothetical protein BDY17DRAFT_17155 [Neohortaea acidophila]|uniref:Apple domain-containing protein n=1 Tax=Neohortaea acidophila TaxID=245834 RepID=A0A6A6Q6Y2_9PEZI|nr:uncharacterized protein BDY17DRAFT_17155 [Neohortaea acidophila]KAF2487726.1 hypothetical protein BDY17DRAFT_17155 [Neohortaea acidophila]